MGKRKRMISGVRFTYDEVATDRRIGREDLHPDQTQFDDTVFDFDTDCLTYLPLKNPLICPHGYSFSRDSVRRYLQESPHPNQHPFVADAPFSEEILVSPKFQTNSNNQKIDPVQDKLLAANQKIVMIRNTGNVYSYDSVRDFNIKANLMVDLVTSEPFEEKDIILIHDPTKTVRQLPSEPIISTKVAVESSDIVKNAKKFVESLHITKENALKPENHWYLARPTKESLNAALHFKGNPPKRRPNAIISTSVGDIVVEIDVDQSTLAAINFIGYAFRGAYTNTRVEKVSRQEFFVVSSKIEVDESVWGSPHAFDRDDSRRNFKYCLFLVNTGNKQIHLSNTAKFGISCKPLDLDENDVFGGVLSGEGIIDSICNGKVFPDGRPTNPFAIKSVSIVNNPFPMMPPSNV